MSQDTLPTRLASDAVRTALAGTLALFALGGWVYSIARPEMRALLPAQRAAWWAEQLLILAQAALCLGLILLRWPRFVRPTLLVTALVLVIGAVHWVAALANGHVSLPLTAVLNALLIWRLRITRTAAISSPSF